MDGPHHPCDHPAQQGGFYQAAGLEPDRKGSQQQGSAPHPGSKKGSGSHHAQLVKGVEIPIHNGVDIRRSPVELLRRPDKAGNQTDLGSDHNRGVQIKEYPLLPCGDGPLRSRPASGGPEHPDQGQQGERPQAQKTGEVLIKGRPVHVPHSPDLAELVLN